MIASIDFFFVFFKIRKKEQEVMDCREEIRNIKKRIRKLLTNKEKEKLKLKKKKLDRLELQLNDIKVKATDAVGCCWLLQGLFFVVIYRVSQNK